MQKLGETPQREAGEQKRKSQVKTKGGKLEGRREDVNGWMLTIFQIEWNTTLGEILFEKQYTDEVHRCR